MRDAVSPARGLVGLDVHELDHWIYFDRGAEAGRRVIAEAQDPGRLARSAYSYFHIPMIAGIIVAAAADELTIAHPKDPATVTTTALILGGPALFLAGQVDALGARAVDPPARHRCAGGARAGGDRLVGARPEHRRDPGRRGPRALGHEGRADLASVRRLGLVE